MTAQTERKLQLSELKRIARETAAASLLEFYRCAIPQWDKALEVDATKVRVSPQLWQWVLSKMTKGLDGFGQTDAKVHIGFFMVNQGPGSDHDLSGVTVRLLDGAYML